MSARQLRTHDSRRNVAGVYVRFAGTSLLEPLKGAEERTRYAGVALAEMTVRRVE
jgi:hypothetical protein